MFFPQAGFGLTQKH
jgi:hypothetical protein